MADSPQSPAAVSLLSGVTGASVAYNARRRASYDSIDDDASDGNAADMEGYENTSSPPRELEQKVSKPYARPRQYWKPVGMMMSFYSIALGHLTFFLRLDGTRTDSHGLRQPQLSAVSILLSTIFQLAMTGTVGMCFTQHLWYALRGEATPVALIDKLFTLRTNLFALGHYRTIWRAPLLSLMALFVWCIGIATIYPAGALTVTFEPWTNISHENVSTLSPPIRSDYNPMVDEAWNISSLSMYYDGRGEVLENGVNSLHGYSYRMPLPVVANLARSIIWSNQIMPLPTTLGENVTYQLQFRGPQLKCNSTVEETTVASRYLTPSIFRSSSGSKKTDYETNSCLFDTWLNISDSIQPRGSEGAETYLESVVSDRPLQVLDSERIPQALVIEQKESPQFYRATVRNVSVYGALVEVRRTTCFPFLASYNVNVTFDSGIQRIQYSIDKLGPFLVSPGSYNWTGEEWPWTGPKSDLQSYPTTLREWIQKESKFISTFNDMALIDAFKSSISGSSKWSMAFNKDNCTRRAKLADGSQVSLCGYAQREEERVESHLRGTVLDSLAEQALPWRPSRGLFDEWDTRSLNLSEAKLNAVLSNLTISALSFGTWYDNVPVTVTRYESTYRFSHRRNLILPYAVSLGVALIFAIIAIWSLRKNGTYATDGGFLQVMMATRGDTELERLALRDDAVVTDDVSKDLQRLKIRYGQLVVGDAEGRLGFGTNEETVAVRKRAFGRKE